MIIGGASVSRTSFICYKCAREVEGLEAFGYHKSKASGVMCAVSCHGESCVVDLTEAGVYKLADGAKITVFDENRSIEAPTSMESKISLDT